MSKPVQAVAAASPRKSPTHFHLLWDSELEELQPILKIIASRREAVLRNWLELYAFHFGPSRALSDHDFVKIFGAELELTVDDLLARNIDQFVAHTLQTGEQLAGLRVPFGEVVVSMHLFEESVTHAFPAGSNPHLYHVFDKLSHIRIIALSQSYFGSVSALAATHVEELEEQARAILPDARSYFHGMVGASPQMRRLYRRIEAAATGQATVLVVGETGTGKELVARALHECGAHPKAPFVALNCAALPRELIESELFGYQRGAFSGANADYLGLFRAAEGGTLFLDEITEMAVETQSKLLRVLQERVIRPVGSTREIGVNVRLVASSNRDPQQAVGEGRLRKDLFYRLYANVLQTPPLRERIADIELLVNHFIRLFNRRPARKSPVDGIEASALEALQRYSWPGNVRELAAAIESAFTFGVSPKITLEDLPETITGEHRAAGPGCNLQLPVVTMVEAERELIQRALQLAEGNKTRTAQLLGVSRKQLYAKITKYRLAVD
jgi:transcriptional regulator with PAS, ATPase and Fis domain